MSGEREAVGPDNVVDLLRDVQGNLEGWVEEALNGTIPPERVRQIAQDLVLATEDTTRASSPWQKSVSQPPGVFCSRCGRMGNYRRLPSRF